MCEGMCRESRGGDEQAIVQISSQWRLGVEKEEE